MAEIVNLRRARKTKARDAAEKQAETNRAKFGRTRAEREQARAEAARAKREHAVKKLRAFRDQQEPHQSDAVDLIREDRER